MIDSGMKHRLYLSAGAALLSCIVGYGFASEADSNSVFSSEGTYASQNGQCTAELKRNAERGGTDLSLFGKSRELISSIDDVNGIVAGGRTSSISVLRLFTGSLECSRSTVRPASFALW
jgi:hypothetical protein